MVFGCCSIIMTTTERRRRRRIPQQQQRRQQQQQQVVVSILLQRKKRIASSSSIITTNNNNNNNNDSYVSPPPSTSTMMISSDSSSNSTTSSSSNNNNSITNTRIQCRSIQRQQQEQQQQNVVAPNNNNNHPITTSSWNHNTNTNTNNNTKKQQQLQQHSHHHSHHHYRPYHYSIMKTSNKLLKKRNDHSSICTKLYNYVSIGILIIIIIIAVAMSITTTTFVTATASTSSSSAITTAISSPSSLLWNTRMTTTKTNRMLKSCNDKNKNNNNNKNSDSLSFLVSSSIRLGLRSALLSSPSPFATPPTTKSSSFCSSRTVSVKKKNKKVSTTDFLGSDSSLPSSISWFRKEQPKQQQQHPDLQYYVDSNNDHDETEVEKENKVDDMTIVESAFFRTTRRTKNKNDGSSLLSLLHDDDDNNNSIRSMRSAFLFQRAMNSNNKKKKTTTTTTTTIDYDDDDDDETIDDELQFLESSIRCHQRNIPASARCTNPVIICDNDNDRKSSVYNDDVDLTVNADIHPSSTYNNNNDNYHHHHRLNPSDNNKKQQQQQQLVDDYNNVIMASIRSNRNIQKTLALIPPDLRAGAVNALASAIAVTTSRPLAFWESMVCGAISRSVAQTTMHPANTMKTILQNTRAGSSDLNFIELMKPKNFHMLTRGAGANFLLSVPHGAINFAVLEFVRKQLGFAISKNEYLRKNEHKFSAGLDFFSSAISTITCSIVSTPQMMITDNIMAGNYPNLISAIRGLAKNGNGIRGFYTGWWPGLVGKIPSYALTWTIFQQLKLARDRINSDRPANDIENSIMGCVASATTVCIMIPLDTIKTRLVTQAGRATSDVAYKGIIDCAVRIIQEEGIRTFYRGLPPRLISVVPMIGIQFGVYEFMKRIMLQRKIEIKTIQLLKELQRGKEYGTYEVLEEALMECAASLDQPYPAPHFLHDVNKKEDDDDDEAKQQQQEKNKNTTTKKEESAAKKK